MNRKQRTIFLVVVFWTVLLGVPGVWLWRADRQERLNRLLLAAIEREDTPLALQALEQGADANARYEEDALPEWVRLWSQMRGRPVPRPMPRTPLLVMLQSRDKAVVVGGRFRRVVHDGRGSYAREDLQLLTALLTHGARVNLVDRAGYPPLRHALIAGKSATARTLLEHGATVAGKLERGDSLLCAIGNCRDATVVEWMLQRGANANPEHPPGGTPLGLAILVGDPAIVRSLLRHKADPVQRMASDPATQWPLQYAEQHHLTEIAKLLRDAGAKR